MHADTIREAELEKAMKMLSKGAEPEAVLASLARGVTNKLIHAPSVKMKQASADGRDEVVQLARELFDLNGDS